MTGPQYERLLKALGLSSRDACERLQISRMSEYLYRRNGPPYVVGELLRTLLKLRRTEEKLQRAQGRRIHVHAPEDRRGGLPAAVVPIRKRKPKAIVTADLQRVITKE